MRFLCSELLILLRCLWFTDTPLCNHWEHAQTSRTGLVASSVGPQMGQVSSAPLSQRLPRGARPQLGGRTHHLPVQLLQLVGLLLGTLYGLQRILNAV